MKTYIILLGLLLAAPIASASDPPANADIVSVDPFYGSITLRWDATLAVNHICIAPPTYAQERCNSANANSAATGESFDLPYSNTGWDCTDRDTVLSLRVFHKNANDNTDHSIHLNLTTPCDRNMGQAVTGLSIQKVGDNVVYSWSDNMSSGSFAEPLYWEIDTSVNLDLGWNEGGSWDWDPGAYPNLPSAQSSYSLPLANYSNSDPSTTRYARVTAYGTEYPVTSCYVTYKLDGALYGCGDLAPAAAVSSAAPCTQDAGGLGSCEPSGWWAFAGPGAVFGTGLIVVFAALGAIKGGKGKK